MTTLFFRRALFFCMVVFLFGSTPIASADSSSDNYQLDKDLIASGSGTLVSDNYRSTVTIGGNNISGVASSMLFKNEFIAKGPETSATNGPDTNQDGVVDVNDVNLVKQFVNQPVDNCPECDVDGDGKISILDARMIVSQCSCSMCRCP